MSKNRLLIFQIALASILASLASVLKIFSIETPFYRFSFFEIPLIISGLTIGPFFGGIAGLITDITYMIVKGYTPSLMTLSTMLWGALPGLLFLFKKYLKNESLWGVMVVITILVTSIICFGINTLQLYLWYGTSSLIANLPTRIMIFFVMLPIQSFFALLIYPIYQKLLQQSYHISTE